MCAKSRNKCARKRNKPQVRRRVRHSSDRKGVNSYHRSTWGVLAAGTAGGHAAPGRAEPGVVAVPSASGLPHHRQVTQARQSQSLPMVTWPVTLRDSPGVTVRSHQPWHAVCVAARWAVRSGRCALAAMAANGGILEGTLDGECRYWINIPQSQPPAGGMPQ